MPMTVHPHADPKELIDMSRRKDFATIADKLRAVAYASEGKTAGWIADKLDRNKSWVTDWVTRFNLEGPAGLVDRPRPGQPTKLKADDEARFVGRVLDGPTAADGDVVRFRGEDLMGILSREFDAHYSATGVYGLLERLGLSHITGRPVHPLKDPVAAASFVEAFPPLPSRRGTIIPARRSKSGSRTSRGSASRAARPAPGRAADADPGSSVRTSTSQPG